MSEDWVTFKPDTLRWMATAFAVFAAIAFAAVVASYIGEPPNWNRANRIADACELGFIACLLADLARARSKRIIITTKETR